MARLSGCLIIQSSHSACTNSSTFHFSSLRSNSDCYNAIFHYDNFDSFHFGIFYQGKNSDFDYTLNYLIESD